MKNRVRPRSRGRRSTWYRVALRRSLLVLLVATALLVGVAPAAAAAASGGTPGHSTPFTRDTITTSAWDT